MIRSYSLWMNNTLLCIYATFLLSIFLLTDTQAVYILAIVSINVGVQVLLLCFYFSFGCVFRHEIARLYNSSILALLRNLHTVFQSDWFTLCSCQQCRWFLFCHILASILCICFYNNHSDCCDTDFQHSFGLYFSRAYDCCTVFS